MSRGAEGGARVFAVDTAAAQVCWTALPEGSALRAGDATVVVDAAGAGGPGAADLDGLAPGQRYDLWVELPGRPPARAASFTTLVPPPGEEVSRFATVNDVHVGERRFGLLGTIREPGGTPPAEGYAARCLAAALDEAMAWGAQALVVKGDLTWHGRPTEWDVVARLLGGRGVPVVAVLGNHDVVARAVDGHPRLAAAGVVTADEPFHLDLPGVRVVLAHSAVPRRSGGRIDRAQRDALAALLATAPGAAYLGLHHYLHHRALPVAYPPGLPPATADALLDAVAAANPATLVSTGHSHRNRRRARGPLVVTQIGATMHYPGVWAGYVVHEGGIRQVVRRVAAPAAITWTEHSRRALLGAWAPWAAGLRRHRCFSHTWPPQPRTA